MYLFEPYWFYKFSISVTYYEFTIPGYTLKKSKAFFSIIIPVSKKGPIKKKKCKHRLREADLARFVLLT